METICEYQLSSFFSNFPFVIKCDSCLIPFSPFLPPELEIKPRVLMLGKHTATIDPHHVANIWLYFKIVSH